MECFVYNWRILLGGAASAAILAVGVAAPAFAQAQDAPVSLSGLNSASGVLCGVSLPVSGEISAAANVIGASCGTSSASSSSSTTSDGIQTNGPMQAGSPAASALPGLNSLTGSIPALGNAANAAPGVANTAGTLGGGSTTTTTTNSATPGFSEEPGSSTTTNNTSSGSSTGLGSVTGTLSGVTGSLQNGSLNGGAISTPLSGQNG
jgi:hypothetical protein